ncbi:MAG: hypothetical protein CMK59_08865 [Proteobacteria bacterium]|nr:hypothetical protein [Pseudomonadota bacterium]
MFKWIFLVVFAIFVGIRLRYGKTEDSRIQFHHIRELISSTMFTLSLLGTTVLFLSSEHLDPFVLNLPDEMRFFGGILALGGNGLLLWVHICLGANFSPHLELREEHTLIVDGPYRILRHPMYTSGLMYTLGCGLLSNNIWVLTLPVSTFVLLIVLRLQDEEMMLKERFGEAWSEHQTRTYKIIPYLY